MYRIDLHTHSLASPDGGLSLKDYKRMLKLKRLDVIAITDHDTISFAQVAQAQLGEEAIIVGEEITTQEGEIIGLYLDEAVPAGLPIAEAVIAIKKQNGLVYIPHPFETVRKGLNKTTLKSIERDIDIIEIRNGRAVFQNHSKAAIAWTSEYKKVGAASSDAHGRVGWGRTNSRLEKLPTRETLVPLLRDATYRTQTVRLGILHPKANRMKRRIKRV